MFNQARRILLLWSKRRNPEKSGQDTLFQVAHSGLSKWMIGSFDTNIKNHVRELYMFVCRRNCQSVLNANTIYFNIFATTYFTMHSIPVCASFKLCHFCMQPNYCYTINEYFNTWLGQDWGQP